MFIGHYQSILNEESLLPLPVQFRGPLSDGAYITRGFEQNLMVMGAEVFQQIYSRVVSLNLTDPLARLLLRLILGNASSVEVDESGKMVVPKDLAEFIGLEKDAVLVGQGDYFELWKPDDWKEQSEKLMDSENNSERFAHLDLASH